MSKAVIYEPSRNSRELAAIPENTQGLKMHVIEYANAGQWQTVHMGKGLQYATSTFSVDYYETGKPAADVVKNLKSEHPNLKSWRVVRYNLPQAIADRMALDKAWIEREAKRLAHGPYKPLPWANETWFKAKHEELKHFAHVSEKKDGLIAFTENSAKGAADVQSRMAPGRYLKTFYSSQLSGLGPFKTGAVAADGITKIKQGPLEHYCSVFSDLYGDSIGLKFAKTAEEMQHVYSCGPSSCMAGKAWGSKANPIGVYAAGDLELAYLEDGGRITARCLVWPEKRVISRVYGDATTLLNRLMRAGYDTSNPTGQQLAGAKLLKIPSRIGFVMPYVDGHHRVHYHPDGHHLAIGQDKTLPNHGIQAGYQNGLSYDPNNVRKCDKCKAEHDGNEGRTLIVGDNGGGSWVNEQLCSKCAHNNYYSCRASGMNFANSMPFIELAQKDRDGNVQRVHTHFVKDHYFQCAGNNLWYSNDYKAFGRYKDTGQYVSQQYVDSAKLVRDPNGRNWWPKDELPAPPPPPKPTTVNPVSATATWVTTSVNAAYYHVSANYNPPNPTANARRR